MFRQLSDGGDVEILEHVYNGGEEDYDEDYNPYIKLHKALNTKDVIDFNDFKKK